MSGLKKIGRFFLPALIVLMALCSTGLAQQQISQNFWDQLTQEQRQTIRQTVQQLRQNNATPEEIRDAVKKLFTDFGVQLPDNTGFLFANRHGGQRRPGIRFTAQLTEEQKTVLRAKIKELKEAGKTREEIHRVVGEMLQSFGVQLPDNWADLANRPAVNWRRPGRGFRLPRGVMSQLNDEQKKELRNKLKELREQKAKPQEIRETLKSLLESYGVTMPDKGKGGGFWRNLSDEQKKTVKDKIKELKEAGKSREEIHAAVGELLTSFGVELPDNWDSMPHLRARRLVGRNAFRHLTQAQRQELKAKIKELKDQGASRVDIRKAVREFLKEHGIKPGQSGRPSPAQRETRNPRNAARLQARNFPNPFNPTTTIEYTLDKPGRVLVQIYNVNGQLVRTLVDTELSAGTHSVLWNGRDANNMPVPSGLYFYRISTGAASVTRGMILMK